MAVSRRAGPSRTTLLVLVLVSVVLITIDSKGPDVLEPVRSVASEVLSPLRNGAEAAWRPVNRVWNGITHYDDVKKENEQLRADLEAAKGKAFAASAAEGELREFHELFELDYVGDYEQVAAKVVAFAPSNFDQTIEIDRGSDKGIKVGMPVVTGAGLLGSVVRVTDHRAFVRLLSDPEFAVGVTFPDVNEDGVANGGQPLQVDFVDPGADIKVGDEVRTSGQEASRFPAGINIGTVSAVHREPGGLQLDVEVEPIADVESFTIVLVLLTRVDEG